ncbi:MAG: TolC family protein [Campylobacter sp.]|nr:TolC family protein [Campylobacter sp.]
MRLIANIFLVVILAGCAGKSAVDNYQVVENFIDENETFIIDEKWYLGYSQASLNNLIDRALIANQDLKIASLNSLQAMAKVGLVSADMLPTFSASWGVESGRDISVPQNWQDSYNASVAVSYELDLYGKIRNSVSAAEWEQNATIYDMEATKLNIINSVVDSYFKELFIRDTLKLLDQNLENYRDLKAIVTAKVNCGKSLPIDLLEINKSILSLENQILNYKRDRVANQELLRNLLHLKPDESLNLGGMPLMEIKFMGVDTSVPVFAVGNRPDLRALISRINASFYDYKISQKDFYPSISLGGSLSASSKDFRGSSELDFLSGSLKINLPFLNYKRLKANLRISELEFDKKVAQYEEGLVSALNEIDRYYYEYQNSILRFENYKDIISNSQQLSKLYLTRYNAGKVELKDYIDAKNSEISAHMNLVSEKYTTLNSEILVYKAMAGKFKNR